MQGITSQQHNQRIITHVWFFYLSYIWSKNKTKQQQNNAVTSNNNFEWLEWNLRYWMQGTRSQQQNQRIITQFLIVSQKNIVVASNNSFEWLE